MNYWLIKSEPSTFSFADLEASPGGRTCWDGVRNYQARNYLRDGMSVGDLAFFYHSGCAEPAIEGIVRIASAAYPDDTAFDPDSAHYDAASNPDDPRWFMVDVQFERPMKRPLTLRELKKYAAGALAGLPLLRRGNRLSVMPVDAKHWQFIVELERR